MMSNERGIALPMALMVMVILTALMAAFAVLATSEPQIASNQVASAQARAVAESGVERVLWALTSGQNGGLAPNALILTAGASGCTPYCLPAALGPYDGATETTLGVGSFKVLIQDGAQPNQKLVTARGYVPNATNPIAIKQIKVTVTRLNWINPLCALCTGSPAAPFPGNVQVGGTATLNASLTAQGSAPAGAYCAGVTPAAAVGATGTVGTNGTPGLYGPSGVSPSIQQNASFPSSMFLSNSDMAALKAMAQARGTYYTATQATWSYPPSNGIIFVDTTDGGPLTSTNKANLHLNGGSGWSGWLVVNGDLTWTGNIGNLTGLIYAQNNLILHGAGNGNIQGAAISANLLDSSATSVDTVTIGNNPISYNCPSVRSGGGTLSQNWFLSPGTYREVSGS
jgi:hypothetical protein